LWTVGSGVGSILGGHVMQRYGAPLMFGIFAGVMLAGCAAAWLLDGAAALAARAACCGGRAPLDSASNQDADGAGGAR
jgi:MFS family permease